MEPSPLFQFLGAVVVIGLMLLSVMIVVELVIRYLRDPKDHPAADVLADYRAQQAEVRRMWRDYRRNGD